MAFVNLDILDYGNGSIRCSFDRNDVEGKIPSAQDKADVAASFKVNYLDAHPEIDAGKIEVVYTQTYLETRSIADDGTVWAVAELAVIALN